jgi:hypothetical protein
MKVKAMPVLASLVSTLVLLFGGWFTYQLFYVQRPIETYIASKPNVVLSNLQINNNQVALDLDFKDPSTFATDYKDIYDYISMNYEGKTISIHLPKQGEALKNVWDQQYFGLAQALQHQEYGQIPQLVDDIKKTGKLDKTVARMDDQNVYLYLQEGKDHLYAVLPLKGEVKNNNE